MITIEQVVKPVKAIIIGEEELKCIYNFMISKPIKAMLIIPLYEKENKKDKLCINTMEIKAKKYLSIHGKEPMFELGVLIDTNKTSYDYMPIKIPDNLYVKDNYENFKKEVINEFGSSYFYERIKKITEDNFDEHIVITTDLKFINITVEKE